MRGECLISAHIDKWKHRVPGGATRSTGLICVEVSDSKQASGEAFRELTLSRTPTPNHPDPFSCRSKLELNQGGSNRSTDQSK
jgi:hypothetical protein